MPYTALTADEVDALSPITDDLLGKVKGNFDFLYASQLAATGNAGIPNGSFESDDDADGTPDNWTAGVYSGGSKSLESSGGIDGVKCMKFTHPGGAGNGGGWIQSDYIAWSMVVGKVLTFAYYATAAGMKIAVELAWYDAAKSAISTTTVYTSTANPTAWTQAAITNLVLPSISARYVKVKLIGGYTDTNVAGSVYFDDVRILAAEPLRQRFGVSESIVTSGYAAGVSYIDVGSSVSITVPSWAKVLGVYSACACESGTGVPKLRFRVDSTYSSENTVTSPGAMGYAMSSELQCDVSALAGSRTFRFQAMDSSAGRTFFDCQAGHLKFYYHRYRLINYAGGTIVDY